MEQYIMNNYGLRALIHNIGSRIADTFVIGDGCQDTLQELVTLLQGENPHTCQVRRQLGSVDLVPKVLVPMLLHLPDQEVENEEEIFALTIRLMTDLTQPIDCLLPAYLVGQASYAPVVADIQSMLGAIKECFLGPQLTASILDHMKTILKQEDPLPMKHCETLNQCLYLFRNILITPDAEVPVEKPLGQLSTLWYMFQAGFHDILLRILSSKQLPLWCVAMVQLISLMYKDEICDDEDEERAGHHMDKMTGDQHSLASESSPSNFHCANGTCKSVNIDYILSASRSEPISDNQSTFVNVSSHGSERGSDQDAQDGKRMMSHNSSSDSLSSPESGLSTDMDTSTPPSGVPLANTYPPENPGAPINERMSQCMDDLMTEINNKLIDFKLREYLLNFTECFLKEGFSNLLKATRDHLLSSSRNSKLPDLYLLWMVGYFLKYAVRFKTPFKSIQNCISVDIIGHLIYSGIQNLEEILLAQKKKEEITAKVKRSELVLTALQSVFFVLDYLEKQQLQEEEKEYLHHLLISFLHSQDLCHYFILLIRKFQPKLQSMNYLRDIIVTNHQFLLLAEKVKPAETDRNPFSMLDQIQKFATVPIMSRYAWLLESFSSNSAHVNECIFTMMYHVAGDCGKPEVLLQLSIVKTFVDIWDANHLLTTESYDLMNSILQCFLHQAQTNPSRVAEIIAAGACCEDESSGEISDVSEMVAALQVFSGQESKEWSMDEFDIIFEVTLDENDPERLVESILKRLTEEGFTRTKKELMVQLFQLGHVSREELEATTSVSDKVQMEVPSLDVMECVDYLGEKSEEQLKWLQGLLLETCYIKMGGRYLGKRFVAEEPVTLHYVLLKASIPIIPYTEEQETVLMDPVFNQLLHQMGFHSADDVERLWPHIPHFWTPDILLEKAQLLGEVLHDCVKVNKEEIDLIKMNSAMNMQTFVEDLDPMFSSKDKPVTNDHLWQMYVQHQSCAKQAEKLESYATAVET